ncbi:MAG: carboxypeptidase-like regulatory domain-containing protein [Bacteroidota bacterium]
MAVTRRTPTSDVGRALALDKAALKLSISPPGDVVLSTATQTRLAILRTALNLNLALRGAALSNQVNMTPQKDAKRKTAGYYTSHFIQGCDHAALRGETGFSQADRAFFQLEATNYNLPVLDNDDTVLIWGQRILTGNTNRLAQGKPVMPYPAIADVNIKYTDFTTIYGDYNLIKRAYDDAQEAISNSREDIDSFILRMWNEIEAAYSEEDAPSKRRNSREWGVVYVLVAGSEPTADDFSITGKVGVAVPGSVVPLADVQVLVVETNTVSYSQANGDYFIEVLPPGTYTIQFSKHGFITQTFSGVVIEAGVLIDNNVAMAPLVTASVAGTVLQGGLPVAATVTIVGTALSAVPDPTGYYTINGITPGTGIVVRAEITGTTPLNFQEQTIMLEPGEGLEVIFAFA